MNALDGLNQRQREAALCTEGPLLILAGAGSGKTRTIISRIAHIIQTGRAYPGQILAITFTNKAAGEMRSRIAEMNIEETERIWMMTFHAACARILRMNADRLGYTKQFKIYDADDQNVLIKKISKELNIDPKYHSPGKIKSIISKCKTTRKSPEELKESAVTRDDTKIAEVYRRYENELKRLDAMDFDDLLVNTIELFEKEPLILEQLRRKFKYILVDEFQDTSPIQYQFVKMLAQKSGNLCVCGDDDQGIVRPLIYPFFFAFGQAA